MPKIAQPGDSYMKHLATKGLLWLESVKSSKGGYPTGGLFRMLLALNDFLISDYFTFSRKDCEGRKVGLEIAMWNLFFRA